MNDIEAFNGPLDPRVQVGVRLEWCKGQTNLIGKGAVASIEGTFFSIRWDDGRVLAEYCNRDLVENGGDVTLEVVSDKV
jgi:hypothetical protein